MVSEAGVEPAQLMDPNHAAYQQALSELKIGLGGGLRSPALRVPNPTLSTRLSYSQISNQCREREFRDPNTGPPAQRFAFKLSPVINLNYIFKELAPPIRFELTSER